MFVYRAQIGIGGVFCISGIAIFTKSVYNLSTASKPFHVSASNAYLFVKAGRIQIIRTTAKALNGLNCLFQNTLNATLF